MMSDIDEIISLLEEAPVCEDNYYELYLPKAKAIAARIATLEAVIPKAKAVVDNSKGVTVISGVRYARVSEGTFDNLANALKELE